MRILKGFLIVMAMALVVGPLSNASAQDRYPADSGLWDYHKAPNYRESESHPLRVVGYILHPIGWVAQEVIFRPLSYFASSTETTRAVMGYRDPFDFRQPVCFTFDDSVPDCHSLAPFNTGQGVGDGASAEGAISSIGEPSRQVYFPDVNFDFDSRKLNDLGEGRVRQVAQLLNQEAGMKIVLEGNTDFRGTATYNEKLGMDRAEAVRQRLVSLGVPADRLSTVTFGLSKPVFTEKEDWARAVNRRVSVQVSGEDASAGKAG